MERLYEIGDVSIVKLDWRYLDAIMREEAKAWGNVQADRDTIERRLSLGHTMLGAIDNSTGEIIGKLCFRFAQFNPNDKEGFPSNFDLFSNGKNEQDGNAVFVYNLDVIPSRRNMKIAQQLMSYTLFRMRQLNCKYGVLDARPSSYHGDEYVAQKKQFKQIIDNYVYGNGAFPSRRELMLDNTLAFYMRSIPGIQPRAILRNFIPRDKASGGIRVIMYKDLTQSEISLSQEWMAVSDSVITSDYIDALHQILEKHKVCNLLECGCGSGRILGGLVDRGILNAVGIDSSKEMIQSAKKQNAHHNNINFRLMNWMDLSKLKQKFDGVICIGNSLVYASSWDTQSTNILSADTLRKSVYHSIISMANKVKVGGIFIVDIASNHDTGTIKIKTERLNLSGYITYKKGLRVIKGSGYVGKYYYKGEAVSYNLTDLELRRLLHKAGLRSVEEVESITHPFNYRTFLAKK